MSYRRICPECGGTDVHPDPAAPSSAISHVMQLSVTHYRCESCGHSGSFFPEVESWKRR